MLFRSVVSLGMAGAWLPRHGVPRCGAPGARRNSSECGRTSPTAPRRGGRPERWPASTCIAGLGRDSTPPPPAVAVASARSVGAAPWPAQGIRVLAGARAATWLSWTGLSVSGSVVQLDQWLGRTGGPSLSAPTLPGTLESRSAPPLGPSTYCRLRLPLAQPPLTPPHRLLIT